MAAETRFVVFIYFNRIVGMGYCNFYPNPPCRGTMEIPGGGGTLAPNFHGEGYTKFCVNFRGGGGGRGGGCY